MSTWGGMWDHCSRVIKQENVSDVHVIADHEEIRLESTEKDTLGVWLLQSQDRKTYFIGVAKILHVIIHV